jgi:hypothetical protein
MEPQGLTHAKPMKCIASTGTSQNIRVNKTKTEPKQRPVKSNPSKASPSPSVPRIVDNVGDENCEVILHFDDVEAPMLEEPSPEPGQEASSRNASTTSPASPSLGAIFSDISKPSVPTTDQGPAYSAGLGTILSDSSQEQPDPRSPASSSPAFRDSATFATATQFFNSASKSGDRKSFAGAGGDRSGTKAEKGFAQRNSGFSKQVSPGSQKKSPKKKIIKKVKNIDSKGLGLVTTELHDLEARSRSPSPHEPPEEDRSKHKE